MQPNDGVTLTTKGALGINRASRARGEADMTVKTATRLRGKLSPRKIRERIQQKTPSKCQERCLFCGKEGSTYTEIADMYSAFVIRKYKKATVVFDGYIGSSTKDAAHLRRNTAAARDISFQPQMTLCGWKEQFLANPVQQAALY